MYLYNEIEPTKQELEALDAIHAVEALMQEYKLIYRVTYGGRNKEVINLEFDDYSLIYDWVEEPTGEKVGCYTICNVPTMNFLYLDDIRDVDTFILSVVESNIPESELN